MKFISHSETDPGRVRDLNEDDVRIVTPDDEALLTRRGELLVVADGMGGHESGEVASRQAVETISEMYYRYPGDPAVALRDAIEEANAVIFRRAQEEGRRGMGTTVVAAARVGEMLYAAHVGDSRLYLVRGGMIRPLTRDHSLVAEQVEAGILTPEEATRHPHRNVISRAVGTNPRVEVEPAAESPLRLREGDVVVLCSDGLTEHVRAEQILKLVQGRDPEAAARALVAAANASGGSDNISVIVGRVGELPESVDKTMPLPTVEGATVPQPALQAEPVADAPRRKRARRLPGLALLLLFLGGGGLAAALFFFPSLLPALPGAGGSPVLPTPSVGRSPAATARPTGTNRAATASPVATPAPSPTGAVTMTVVAPEAPLAPDVESSLPPTRTIILLAPSDGETTNRQTVTFRVQVPDQGPNDLVQLLLGQAQDSLLPVPQNLAPVGSTWQLELAEPPGGYGTWFWTVQVTDPDQQDLDGNFLQFRGPVRLLNWLPPTE